MEISISGPSRYKCFETLPQPPILHPERIVGHWEIISPGGYLGLAQRRLLSLRSAKLKRFGMALFQSRAGAEAFFVSAFSEAEKVCNAVAPEPAHQFSMRMIATDRGMRSSKWAPRCATPQILQGKYPRRPAVQIRQAQTWRGVSW